MTNARSSAVAISLRKSFILAGLALGFGLAISAQAAVEPRNVMDIITEATGQTQAAAAAACATGVSYSAANGPSKCFDGIAFSREAGDRYLGQIQPNAGATGAETGGAYVTLAIPDAARPNGEFYELVAYDVHRQATGWYSRDRAPASWILEGTRDGVTWVQIDSRLNVAWSGGQTTNGQGGSDPDEADCHKTFDLTRTGTGYKAFRFTPKSSNYSGAWDVGLFELVYWVVPESGLKVYHGEKVLGCAGFSHANGATIYDGSATVTAPRTLTKDGIKYNCAGYILSSTVGTTVSAVTNLNGVVSYPYEADGKKCSLTWLWSAVETSVPTPFRLLAALWSANGSGDTAGYEADKLFDGVAFTTDATKRWLSSLDGKVTVSLDGGKPWQGLSPKLAAYRLYQHSTGYACNSRAPTAWTLEGSENGTDWETIETVTGAAWVSQGGATKYGIGMSADGASEKSPYALGEPEANSVIERAVTCTKTYTAFRFTPTASKWTGSTAAGLMELELLLDVKDTRPVLTVAGEPAVPGVSPDYGDVADDAATCTAPEIGFLNGLAYRCTGYRKETRAPGATDWTLVGTSPARFVNYVRGDNAVRITWLWESVAARLQVRPMDGGLETVMFASSDYVNPAEPDARYYAGGKNVQVTLNPATDPASTFTGEIFGDVEGVQVNGNVLTVPMAGTPRMIEARFDRHWKWMDDLPAGSDAKLDYLTDGNWTIAVTPYELELPGLPKETCYRFSTENADGQLGYVAGSGRLDLTHVNADLVAQGQTLKFDYFPSDGFAGVAALTELIVPRDITSGFGAPFGNCPNLKRVVFEPDAVRWKIHDNQAGYPSGQGCFAGCTALETVVATNLTRVMPRMFQGCTKLTNAVFGTSLKLVDTFAFMGCKGFAGQTLAFPSLEAFSVYAITNGWTYSGAFQGANIDVLDLSTTQVTNLPRAVLDGLTYKTVKLPETIESIQAQNITYSSEQLIRRIEFLGIPPDEMEIEDNVKWTKLFIVPKNYISAMRQDPRFVDKASPEFNPTGDYAAWYKSPPGQAQIKGAWNDQYLAAGPSTRVGTVILLW